MQRCSTQSSRFISEGQSILLLLVIRILGRSPTAPVQEDGQHVKHMDDTICPIRGMSDLHLARMHCSGMHLAGVLLTGMHPKLMAITNNQPLTKYFKVLYCCRCKGLSLFLQQSHSLQHLHFAEIAAFKLYAFTANSKAHAVHTCFGRQMHMATYYKVTPLSHTM